jgi:hypothetical protein
MKPSWKFYPHVTHPQTPRWTHYKSKGEDNGKKKNWGAFPGLQHFGGKGVC